MSSVIVKVRMTGGTWTARAGRGKAACSASCTMDERTAAQRAAAKFFRIDACNVLTADDLIVKRVRAASPYYWRSEATYEVAMPESKGGPQ